MNRRSLLQAGGLLLGTSALSLLVKASEATASGSESNGEYEVTKTEAEWRELLTPQQFRILRQQGTERPGSSPLTHNHEAGNYTCAGCGSPVFSSQTKFDSGTGWPSFYAPIEGGVATSADRSFLMVRTEVHCDRCGGHLGHVFDDGPQPTGKRYCINGAALEFVPASSQQVAI
ncbi:MAG: peptide-methionine (R)-S-oxide reductase MsrB [Elainellaceae cyanobacterium]